MCTPNLTIWMPQGHTPLGVIHFWGPLWDARFFACIYVPKSEWHSTAASVYDPCRIYFAKVGFVDCNWSNLIILGSYTPCGHSFLESIMGCPFLGMHGKKDDACGLFIEFPYSLYIILSGPMWWIWPSSNVLIENIRVYCACIKIHMYCACSKIAMRQTLPDHHPLNITLPVSHPFIQKFHITTIVWIFQWLWKLTASNTHTGARWPF